MRAGVVVAISLASIPATFGCIHQESASTIRHSANAQSEDMCEAPSEDAEPPIVLPEQKRPPPRPIRTTQSLGFIGDNPLTPSRTYGGPWAAPDAVLPKHSHSSGSRSGYGYRSYGYRYYR